VTVDRNDTADALWGAAEIGRAIGKNPRQTFHLLEARALPAKKVLGQWVASRKRLLHAVFGDDSA
jgi:hypothetical protein